MYTAEYYLVEIASALLGLSYPFIYQIISNIDIKYNSINIVRLFKAQWGYRAYNVGLIILMLCVLAMPFISDSKQGERLELVSYQTICLFVLAVNFILALWLFRMINVFYDYVKLHEFIKKNINGEISNYSLQLKRIENDIKRNKRNIDNAAKGKFWISDYEIVRWKKSIKRCDAKKERIGKLINDGSDNFKCLIDLLHLAIRCNYTDLYLQSYSTFQNCVETVKAIKYERAQTEDS